MSTTRPSLPRRLLAEPLVHFLLIGAALFAVYDVFRGPAVARDPLIVVTVADQRQLAAVWQRQWQRLPTEREIAGLVEAFVRDEVLAREAIALGLDEGDTIIRRRLAQKMTFLAQGEDAAAEPTTADLETYYERHTELFRQPELFTFSHVFVSPDRRGEAAERDAAAILAALRSGADPTGLGDRFMLQMRYGRRSALEIDQLFGAGFAAQLESVPLDTWQGPVRSGYGLHAVRVEQRIPPRLPALDEVRREVRDSYLAARQRDAERTMYDRLRRHYRVEVEAPPGAGPQSGPIGGDDGG